MLLLFLTMYIHDLCYFNLCLSIDRTKYLIVTILVRGIYLTIATLTINIALKRR